MMANDNAISHVPIYHEPDADDQHLKWRQKTNQDSLSLVVTVGDGPLNTRSD